MRRHDAVIVGAGPAGIATALALARAGVEPLVLDARRPPIDKACGEGLMPDGVAALQGLGVELGDDVAPLDGIRWIDGAAVVDGRFPGAPGLGVRRIVLHEALVAAVARAGIEVRWGTPVRGLGRDHVDTDAGRVHAGVIVGADGLRSAVRRLAGLSGRQARRERFGLRRHVGVAPWAARVEVYWDDEGEAYVTPVGPREVGVALLSAGRPARFDDIGRRFPALARRLCGAPVVSADRGAGPLAQHVRSVRRGRVLLVGDAAGYLDAITGEGLSLAFRQASALADAVARDDPGSWPAAHRRIVRQATWMTRLVLALARWPTLRRRVMHALAADPRSFDRLLAVHVGAAAVHDVGAHALARVLWRVVRPAVPLPQ